MSLQVPTNQFQQLSNMVNLISSITPIPPLLHWILLKQIMRAWEFIYKYLKTNTFLSEKNKNFQKWEKTVMNLIFLVKWNMTRSGVSHFLVLFSTFISLVWSALISAQAERYIKALLVFLFFVFWPHRMAWEILVPQPEIEPRP